MSSTPELPYLEPFEPLFSLPDDVRTMILYGGAGSGKSRAICQAIVYEVTKADVDGNRHRALALRKVQEDVGISIWLEFLDVLAQANLLDNYVTVNKSARTFTWPNGSSIYCRGLDRVERKKSLSGFTLVWLEEATEFSGYDYDQMNLRLRGRTPVPLRIYMSFNPVDRNHWIYRRWFDRGILNPPPDSAGMHERFVQHENMCAMHSTYQDNMFLDPEYVEVVEGYRPEGDLGDKYLWEVYGIGEWSTMGNLILTNWRIDSSVPTSPWAYDQHGAGLDFGFNHPSAFERMGMKDGILHVWQEIHQRGLTNSELIDRVGFLEPSVSDTSELIIADSAEPDRIVDFQKQGYYIRGAEKGGGSVRADINWLKDLPLILVHPSCRGIANELRGWKWREMRDGTVIDEPVAIHDDGCAAMRYGTQSFRSPQVSSAVGYVGRKSSRYQTQTRGY